jgi:dTDP-4-amino-4,6-dideoxygalactose transaminase
MDKDREFANGSSAPPFSPPLRVGRPNVGSRETFLRLVGEMFDRGCLSNDGPLVVELEKRIAAYLGVAHCIAICNGTVALQIAIRAVGMTGEVIVPSYTFIATAQALLWQGITPVFADIDPVSHNLDPVAVRQMITPRTTGMIGVHLWGRAAPIPELETIAKEHGLHMLYDSAHAFGCSMNGKMIGGFGRAEVFSFHATKFFNTFEGGAIVTDDHQLADKVRLMRNFGFGGPADVIQAGTNGKMPEVCAAMGLANFDHLDTFIEAKWLNYQAYCHGLRCVPGVTLLPYNETERNNFQYVVIEVGPGSAATRNEIVAALHARNVWARKYFWPGCHAMLPHGEPFPRASLALQNTILVAERVAVLPTGMNVTIEEVRSICGTIRKLATSGATSI